MTDAERDREPTARISKIVDPVRLSIDLATIDAARGAAGFLRQVADLLERPGVRTLTIVAE